MSFIEAPRFPMEIANGSVGGPGYLTNIVEFYSGYEQRNSVWAESRQSYDAATGVKEMSDIEDILYYFHAVKGRLHSFRFKDRRDWKSCKTFDTISPTDQSIGIGDSTDGSDGTASFQLIKTYVMGPISCERDIKKPVSGTVVAAIDGVATTNFAVNTTTGIITFTAGNWPLVGEVITAGYEFDVPVRFDVDRISLTLDDYRIGSASIPLIEVKI